MKIVITAGPAFEPIDDVRRITNFSTGELGILLANRLAHDGHDVTLFKGVAATCPLPVERGCVMPFSTNDDLRAQLAEFSGREKVGAVFHAAALCDFRVVKIFAGGGIVSSPKIPSTGGQIQLTLEAAPKLIAGLRDFFPRSKIIGWKYELAGTGDEAIAKALEQIRANRTDACVVNGAAFGSGFGFCENGKLAREFGDKATLCDFLAEHFAAVR